MPPLRGWGSGDSFWAHYDGRASRGLKPGLFTTLYAALKRRSSTVGDSRSLHYAVPFDFAQGPAPVEMTGRKKAGAEQDQNSRPAAPKGAADLADLTAPLKRCPDTNRGLFTQTLKPNWCATLYAALKRRSPRCSDGLKRRSSTVGDGRSLHYAVPFDFAQGPAPVEMTGRKKAGRRKIKIPAPSASLRAGSVPKNATRTGHPGAAGTTIASSRNGPGLRTKEPTLGQGGAYTISRAILLPAPIHRN